VAQVTADFPPTKAAGLQLQYCIHRLRQPPPSGKFGDEKKKQNSRTGR